MLVDHLGHPAAATLGYRPRTGQWVCFRVTDAGKHVALAEQGAHLARDGSLVGIFVDGHRDSPTRVARANGAVELTGGTWHPPQIHLVDANGHNFTVPVRRASGHGEWVNVFFYLDSPNLRDLRPLEDLADMPPGRVVAEGWKPAA